MPIKFVTSIMTYKTRTEEQKLKRRLNDRMNPDRVWRDNLKAKYRISVEKYFELFEQQKGVCKICNKFPNDKNVAGNKRRLAVDHCHETKTIRGLLCSSCNIAVGGFRNNIDIMKSAIKYLKYWQNKELKPNRVVNFNNNEMT